MNYRLIVRVLGGTLDPFGINHLDMIKASRGENILLVIAPTLQNPWKDEPTLLKRRLDMAELVLNAEGIPNSREFSPDCGVYLCDFLYTRVCTEFVPWWRETYPGKLEWIVGPESAESASEWLGWNNLTPSLDLFILPEQAAGIHASDVRNGTQPPHPAIRSYLKQYDLLPDARW